jgi:hypothetical protein
MSNALAWDVGHLLVDLVDTIEQERH